MKKVMVLGGGGFIGSHLVTKLKQEGCWVRAVDIKKPEFSNSVADDFVLGDLRSKEVCDRVFDQKFDEVYQLAADMGGAGYIFTGGHDADVMHNSCLININVTEKCREIGVGRIFYSSSACIYPSYNQEDPNNPKCSEDSAYPANPDSEYGWEKLFSERLYLAYMRNYGIEVRIGRFHNIFGPEGSWNNGKEKAPAAVCRKVAEAKDGSFIELWGDGKQTRSFMYIDECLEGVLRFTRSNFSGPLNIGSDEMISIDGLARMVIDISGKSLEIRHIPGPMGVRGRNSDNLLIAQKIGWSPSSRLRDGIQKTYCWISKTLNGAKFEGVG